MFFMHNLLTNKIIFIRINTAAFQNEKLINELYYIDLKKIYTPSPNTYPILKNFPNLYIFTRMEMYITHNGI